MSSDVPICVGTTPTEPPTTKHKDMNEDKNEITTATKAATGGGGAGQKKTGGEGGGGGSQHPPWYGKRGTKRVVLEYRNLEAEIRNAAAAETAGIGGSASAHVPPVYDLSLVGEAQDDVSKWRFKMRDFDDSSDGGRRLNADLRRLHREHGCDHLLLEVWGVAQGASR